MINIYKIFYSNKIILFIGNLDINKNNVFNKNIFTDEEKIYIDKNNIEILFFNEIIYTDDTIKDIKKKIIMFF